MEGREDQWYWRERDDATIFEVNALLIHQGSQRESIEECQEGAVIGGILLVFEHPIAELLYGRTVGWTES